MLPKRESRGENADPEIEEEVVEVDDVIGWEICLSKAGSESRQYVIEAAVLDPAEDEHPVRDRFLASHFLVKLLLTFHLFTPLTSVKFKVQRSYRSTVAQMAAR